MDLTEFLEQYSKAVELAECRITDYQEFSDKYNLEDRDFFDNKLKEIGYSNEDAVTISINKDLILSLYMNDFEFEDISEDELIYIDVELENARQVYMDAVDKANLSIDAANDSRVLMESLKELVENKYGTNSNLWDNSSVKELNEAIELYNRLVEKANLDVEAVKVARQHLAEIRNRNSENLTLEIEQMSIVNNNGQNNVVVEIN